MATLRTNSISPEREKVDAEKHEAAGDELEFSHDLHRGLKARHITMIAIGGAIGTGLIIGTYVFVALDIHSESMLINTF